MDINTKLIFTTNNEIFSFLVEKFSAIKIFEDGFSYFDTEIEIEDETQKLLIVYSSKDLIGKVIEFISEKYIITKFLNVGISKILRNQDLQSGDIMLPNSFMDRAGEKALFLDYAIGENYDLNSFGLILNGISMDERFGLSEERAEYLRQELSVDIVDEDSFLFLNLLGEKQEDSVIIRLCLNNEDELNNFLLTNLVNIMDIMI